MKAKLTAKKILSVILATLMLFSAMSISASAEVAEKDCPHNLGEQGWAIVKEPTCRSNGIMQKWCMDCQDFVQREIQNDPEDLSQHIPGLWTTVIPHDCYQAGYEVIYCAYGCTKSGTDEKLILAERTIPAHSYTVIYKEEPTCIKGGYTFSMCTDCREMKTVESAPDEKMHSFGADQIIKEATCISEGEIVRDCLLCGYSETETIKVNSNHTDITEFKDKTVAPTCDKEGYIPCKCNDCGADLEKTLPRHSYSKSTLISRVESTCRTHGVERRLCQGYYGEDGKFVYCGLEYEVELDLVPENHVYSEWKISKEPDCKPGERYRYCIYEPSVYDRQTIPATGEHKYGDWITVVEGTCSLTGTRKKVCATCGDEIFEGTGVKHDLTEWVETVKMSCDESELQNGKKVAYCNNCSYSKTFTVPSVHSFSEWRVTIKADCKEGQSGEMQRTCSGCGKVEKKTYEAEHDFTAWIVTDKPVCGSKTGTYTRMCKDCGKTEEKGIGTDHEYESVITKYAVCAQKPEDAVTGEKVETCKFCGKTATETFKADHVYDEWKTVKLVDDKYEADDANNYSCGEKYLQIHTCYTCGDIASREVTKEHTYGNWYVKDNNSNLSICGKSGDTNVATLLTHTCKKCGYEVSENRTEQYHPNLKTVKYEATCTTSGYTIAACPDCTYSEILSEIEPIKGHSLDESWTIRVQPTCDSFGMRYKACSECDYLEFQRVDKSEHMLIQISPAVEATCTSEGKTAESYCGVCQKHFPSETIEKLEHVFAEGSEVCSMCYAYENSPGKSCVCVCHSSSGMEALIFKIMCKLYSFFGTNQYCKCGVKHYEEVGLFAKLFGTAKEETTVK